MALLSASDVSVAYRPSRGERIWAVRDIDVSLQQGEFVGIVGESGSGKSTLGYALTRMLRPPARLESGVIRFDGTDIASLTGERLRRQRRHGFALVLQSGMNALNPVRTVARQFGDVLKAHAEPGDDLTGHGITRRSAALLEAVQLEPAVLSRYPHELSGGMRQRVAIGLALALELPAGDGARELVDQAPSAVTAAMIAPAIKAIRIVRKSASLLPDARWPAATRKARPRVPGAASAPLARPR